ncbi:uncharacterized protein B0I36DRAFT_24704 [Microdochium trichocladiopsis]|uniref:Uncharacterized protein n=1 Tax=Microdochium trichocladiopsis TaxID=1682393 RepID=A0A9P8YKA2_9PEZI|nr:uncharacterized protein B0I36DRAFT_24704 [Microdochium trichocladiopsis]KAH7041588.1 hypothetical protein B0I36DRAFT_24704 [Microdochium trichocladiopsis]
MPLRGDGASAVSRAWRWEVVAGRMPGLVDAISRLFSGAGGSADASLLAHRRDEVQATWPGSTSGSAAVGWLDLGSSLRWTGRGGIREELGGGLAGGLDRATAERATSNEKTGLTTVRCWAVPLKSTMYCRDGARGEGVEIFCFVAGVWRQAHGQKTGWGSWLGGPLGRRPGTARRCL